MVWFVCYLVKIIYLIAGPIVILSELRRVHSYRIEKMAVMNGCDSSTTDTETKKNVSFCWGNSQSTLAFPFLKSPISNFSPPQLPTSISNAVDNCSNLLHSLASQNPFLNKLLSISSQFHDTCVQVSKSCSSSN